MIVFLNGQFVPEAQAVITVFDRSFLYGDGLFETMRVANGKPFRWTQHCERLERGAEFLGIRIPFSREALAKHAAELTAQNQMPEALLRLTLSRGVGMRGYSPKGADKPALVMTLHPFGAQNSGSPGAVLAELELCASLRWSARTASFHLPANEALAQFKTCNKLAQILARAEAEAAGANEALLLNTNGFVVEGASSNLFWIECGMVCTPPLASGVLAGVTREVVRELCAILGLPCRELNIQPQDLVHADAAFLSLSSHGIVELAEIDGTPLGHSPVVGQLLNAYHALVMTECR
jgi:branched-chain amino acid aminotransferase